MREKPGEKSGRTGKSTSEVRVTKHAASPSAVHGVHQRRVVGLGAGRRELLLAHVALAATDVETGDDTVSDLELRNARTDRLDDTHALVSKAGEERKRRGSTGGENGQDRREEKKRQSNAHVPALELDDRASVKVHVGTALTEREKSGSQSEEKRAGKKGRKDAQRWIR
jgi:hypothetical protein